MKITNQIRSHRIVQSVKYNLIKVFILSEGMIVVLRLPEGAFCIF